MLSDVTTEFVRRHYAKGPTAYNVDGSIVRMPTPADVEYAGRQFDRWLAAHDRQALQEAAKSALNDWAEGLRRERPHEWLARRAAIVSVSSTPEHQCESCEDCLHDGAKCCGCYDGVCCREAPRTPEGEKL